MSPRRYLDIVDLNQSRLVHAVWELTLACDLRCKHCGSRAGRRRPSELTTKEALGVVAQLADLGTREVTLIGGEAYLRRDWIEIVGAIRASGMNCTLQTGGRGLTAERARHLADAGLDACGVSLDGLQPVHDYLRGVDGAYAAAIAALGHLSASAIRTSVNTQINAMVLPDLPELMERIIEARARSWQVQLTVPMGRAADNAALLLQPHQMLEVMPLLADLYRQGVSRGLLLQPGNNIGYFGPFESLLRGGGNDRVHWLGCTAGTTVMGIESDGTVKGCPSLPTAGYTAGNIHAQSLAGIWASEGMGLNRPPRPDRLWGFCAGCYYATTCRGGCTWTSHSLLGRPGNNPYCHHRALQLDERGRRERVVQIEQAPGRPFDAGRFEIVLEERVEEHDGDGPGDPAGWRPVTAEDPAEGRPAGPTVRPADGPSGTWPVAELEVCRRCRQYVYVGTEECPFCAANLVEAAQHGRELLEIARRAEQRLRRALAELHQDGDAALSSTMSGGVSADQET